MKIFLKSSAWPLVVYAPWMKVSGLALWPFILVDTPRPSKRLINHERIHLRQQIELFLVIFYMWYLLEYLFRRLRGGSEYQAYRNICFEREAYHHDDDMGYLHNRKPLAFWQFYS